MRLVRFVVTLTKVTTTGKSSCCGSTDTLATNYKMKITLQGELTDLNTYINAERRNRFIGAKIKKENTEDVMWQTKGKKCVDKYPVRIHIDWYTPTIRKDPDNTAFAKKFILDGLVENGILEGDTRKHIKGFSDDFHLDKENPRIELFIES
jgi:hypothetical protein